MQPASLDLRLGDVAYRIRCSFLLRHRHGRAQGQGLRARRDRHLRDDGAVLERNCPYLIPLRERLALPPGIRARTNPKSSTGRLDVFTRVITDHSYRFDEIAAGYEGRLYLEVVPLSFTVRVKEGLALNQLRLIKGRAALDDDDLRARHADRADPVPRRASRCPTTSSPWPTACSSASTCGATRTAGSAGAPAARPRCSRWAASTTTARSTSGTPCTTRTATASCSSPGASTCCSPTRA